MNDSYKSKPLPSGSETSNIISSGLLSFKYSFAVLTQSFAIKL